MIVEKKKRRLIIVGCIVMVLLFCILLEFFLPSFHYEECCGLDYYSDGEYKNLGYGFNRYGDIASEYLPKYEEIYDGSTYVDFSYIDSNNHMIRYVAVCVGVRYTEDIYLQKRDKLLNSGIDIGSTTYQQGKPFGTQNRLLAQNKRLNQEHLYYIVECTDIDNSIMYMVFFASKNILFGSETLQTSHITAVFPFTLFDFWRNLHPHLYGEEGIS